jgi:ABC-2 type transport system permease protein
MNVRHQSIAFYTIIRRELVRMFRIATQVFLPPVITSTLYFLIFGTLIGRRIGNIDGVPFLSFMAPGLIMMMVITNAYGNVSGSLFSSRFQRSIEEMLISPVHNSLILLGFICGGIARGVIVALLVFSVSSFFVSIQFDHLLLTFCIVILVSALFSMAGFINGMMATSFDDIMIIPTFVLGPLTYLGGVFYSVNMLSPFWNTITHFNPIFYMVEAFRYALIGHTDIPIQLAMGVIVLILVVLTGLNLVLLRRGVGLRE